MGVFKVRFVVKDPGMDRDEILCRLRKSGSCGTSTVLHAMDVLLELERTAPYYEAAVKQAVSDFDWAGIKGFVREELKIGAEEHARRASVYRAAAERIGEYMCYALYQVDFASTPRGWASIELGAHLGTIEAWTAKTGNPSASMGPINEGDIARGDILTMAAEYHESFLATSIITE